MFEENFLGGPAAPRRQSLTLSHDPEMGWVVDAGTIHGIPQPVGGETAVFAIFLRTATPEERREMKAALGMARVWSVEPGRSAVEITGEKEKLSENEVYQAVLATVPIPPMNVRLEGDEAGIDLIRTALATVRDTGGQSLFVREAPGADAQIRLVAVAPGHYRTLRPADGRRLIPFAPWKARRLLKAQMRSFSQA